EGRAHLHFTRSADAKWRSLPHTLCPSVDSQPFDRYASNLSKDPVQPWVIPPLDLIKVSSSSRVVAPYGSQFTVTRVRSGPSPVNSTVFSIVSGQVGAMGWRETFPFSSHNCWV